MAKELVEAMIQLGFPFFTLIGHDRGGRVAYRLALDHPKNVERLAVFDVIPILEAWNRADARFAQTYWPWILLSQKQPLPESYLLGAPSAVFDNSFGHGSFGPEILEEYVSTYRDASRVHGICEEYRAAATIDVEHDSADKLASRRIECPMLHLWAEGGPLDSFYTKDGGPLGIWRQWAPRAQGQAMKGGHFFPEENPETPLRSSSASLRRNPRRKFVGVDIHRDSDAHRSCRRRFGLRSIYVELRWAEWIASGRKHAVNGIGRTTGWPKLAGCGDDIHEVRKIRRPRAGRRYRRQGDGLDDG
jgi:pimeloyl-ACP methyl ester carboxylesterase